MEAARVGLVGWHRAPGGWVVRVGGGGGGSLLILALRAVPLLASYGHSDARQGRAFPAVSLPRYQATREANKWAKNHLNLTLKIVNISSYHSKKQIWSMSFTQGDC